MKTISILSTLFLLLLTTSIGEAQTASQSRITEADQSTIQVLQFHSEHRCMTCNKIESLTKETLERYSAIPFALVNVDDRKNAKMAAQFEAAGTALYLYNTGTGEKKDLTDFAFMNARNKEKYIAGLKKEIDKFID